MLSLILCASLLGQVDQNWSTPREAAIAAHKDCASLPAFDRPFARYVWIPDRSKDSQAACNHVINLAASLSRVIQHGVPVSDSVVRFDGRTLDPEGKTFFRLWESMSDEPDFHVDNPLARKVKIKPYKAGDGKTYDWKWEKAREYALHASPNDLLSLRTFTGSEVPIVELRFMFNRMLTTLDQGTGKGQYYQFTNTQLDTPGKTDLAVWLESMGADPEVLENTSPRNKVAVFFSEVTAKPRAIIFIYATDARPSDAVPIVTLTLDIQNGDVDPKQHSVKTLIGAKFRGGEGIGFRPNGMPWYVVYNAAGDFLDAVPENIARDGTVPFPFTDELQPAIGCMRCHNSDEGWKPAPNDVTLLLEDGLIPLRDDSSKNPLESLEQIHGEYQGDLTGPLTTVRNGYNSLALRTTGGLWFEKSATTVVSTISNLFASYNYTKIGPEVALMEIGRSANIQGELQPGERLVFMRAAFTRAIPKLTAIPETGNIPVEDVSVGGLRKGVSILRSDFNAIKADLYLRSQANLDKPVPAAEDKLNEPNKPKEEAKP